MGVILYILLSGSPPFNGSNDGEILRKVKEGRFSFTGNLADLNYLDPIWKKRTQESMDLIQKLLTYDPEKRISALEALEHPWIQHRAQEKIDIVATTSALNNLAHFRVSL